jgi:predicted TIM-barrel fold metal-dependent hydrolase
MLTHLSLKRRQMLAALGSAMLVGLSGCCSLRQRPGDLIGASAPPKVDRRWLTPETIQKRSQMPSLAIDVHAHFFNASDVNVEGYVRESFGHSLAPALQPFCALIAIVLDDLAGFAKTAAEEYAQLNALSNGVRGESPSAIPARLDSATHKRRQEIATQLHQTMGKHGALLEYRRLKTEHLKVSRLQGGSPELTPDRIVTLLEPNHAFRRLMANDRRAEIHAMSINPDGLVTFAGYMLQERWMNVRTYSRAYSSDVDAFGIDAAFGALVDFDHWLDCPAHSSRRDQMKVQSLISELSGGYMLPLIGYNPWSDIVGNGESFRLVQDAITQFGYVGVKIYPPMGFYPYGNATLPYQSKYSRPEPKALDLALGNLFTWCAEHSVPVMSHTGQSMGRDCASDHFGGPDGWNALLNRSSNSADLPIINLGHFGGDDQDNPYCKVVNPPSWPHAFADLMREPSGAHVYGDIAYWSKLRACIAGDTAECNKIINRLRDAKSEYPELSSRLMYGTDWLMCSQESDWTNYPQKIVSALQNDFDLDSLFYKNALTCFGLTAGPQRTRIENRFGAQTLPAWLT